MPMATQWMAIRRVWFSRRTPRRMSGVATNEHRRSQGQASEQEQWLSPMNCHDILTQPAGKIGMRILKNTGNRNQNDKDDGDIQQTGIITHGDMIINSPGHQQWSNRTDDTDYDGKNNKEIKF